MRRLIALGTLAAVLVGCGRAAGLPRASGAAQGTVSMPAMVTGTPDASQVQPVSISTATGAVADAMTFCDVGLYTSQVRGIGVVTHARDLREYGPFTGTEPELQTDSPAFIVEYTGTVRIATVGGVGAAGYVDVTNAVCVVIEGRRNWYLSGPWTDAAGRTGTPPPVPAPAKAPPALLP